MFSYYGETVFQFNEPEQGKNIILIAGRNGHGKTSFINSIKLLFTGPRGDLLSSIPGNARVLSPKQYVLGAKDQWVGVFNRKAKKQGQDRFYVKIVWVEEQGRVEAKREWVVTGENYTEELSIMADHVESVLKDSDAQDFLDERLPSEYIPFFYFDGEQIHKMIDISQNNIQKNMERLLNINQIETAREYIGKAETEWKKAAMVEEEKAKLQAKQNDQALKQAEIKKNDEKIKTLLNEISELEDEVEQVSRRLDRLMESSQIGDQRQLRNERTKISEELEELTRQLVDDLTEDTPLVFNTALIREVMGHIRLILESDTGAQKDLIDSFIRTVPGNLFDNPPYPDPCLTDQQIRFYKKRLTQLFEAFIPSSETSALFAIDKRRASRLSDNISPYMNTDIRKKTMTSSLKRLNHYKKRIVEIDLRLEDIPGLNRNEKEEFEEAKKTLTLKSELKGNKEEEIRLAESSIRSLTHELKKLDQEIQHQGKQVNLSGIAKDKMELALKLKSFFKQYKEEMKKDRRERIESRQNTFVNLLITSHKQIDHIRVDDEFILHPMDKNMETIGINSLSSGIRQLIATALLWALNDVSGKTVPLVIDTPLGRIDMDHQEILLKQFYPAVGKQVILLPTDSEITPDKYKVLKPHICQEFILSNMDGESTVFQEKPLY